MGARPSVGLPGRYFVLSDLHAAPDTRLDLAYLERRLRHYPDQSLAANILEGVRLDAGVELKSVWVPHLTSLPLWIRLRGQGTSAPPLDLVVRVLLQPPLFRLMYLNGQGETALTSGPDRHLRRLRSIGWYEFYPSLPSSARVPQRPGGDSAQVGAGQAPAPHRGQRTARPHLRRLRPPGHLLISPASRPMASRATPRTTSTSLSWRPRSYTRHGRRRRRG